MNRMVPAFAWCLSALAAGCETSADTPAAGRATMAEVEQACTARLSREANVPASNIRVTDSTGSSEGSAVFLSLNGAPWICRADGAGNITAIEFQGEG